MEENNTKLEIETIGIPYISSLSKEDYLHFIKSIEFQVREYYKSICTKKDNNPP